MARSKMVRLSDEELDALETARDRIFGTDSVPLGKAVGAICGDTGTEDNPWSYDEMDEIVDKREMNTPEHFPDGRLITNMVVGIYHENYDGRTRGAYPENLDPADFVGTIRRFTGKNIQYLQVIGDLDGHAVYRMVNEGRGATLNSMPWDKFIEETARVNPDAPGTPDDDPARTAVRTNFDELREERDTEVEQAHQ